MPEFYYKLLQRICEKPYIDYQGLREDFCHKKDLDFQQGLDFLWINDYIIVKPFKSAAEDTGESYLIRNSNGAVKPIKIGPYMHLILSVSGTAYVDERRRRFWGFVLPYSITTAISLASIFLQFYNTFFA